MSEPIEVNINGRTHTVLCGLCKTPITFRGEADMEGEAGCAGCDNFADVQGVADITLGYVQDEAQRLLNISMKNTFKGNKFIKFTGQTLHKKRYRFIIEV